MDREIWTAAVAHHLHRHWRTLTAEALEDAAQALWTDERLREMPPAEAAAQWLRPIEQGVPIHGILDTLPAVYSIEAARQLPLPTADSPDHAAAVLDVPGAGKVRFTFERRRQMMPKPGPWFWGVCHAAAAAGDEGRITDGKKPATRAG